MSELESILTKNQKQTKCIPIKNSKLYPEFNGKTLKIQIRYDDECGNKHNTFSITGSAGGNNGIGGCIHDFIIEQAPELEKFIKWHLTSSDGPMHYIANSMYHASEGKLDFARNSAVWPEANLVDFSKAKLLERLPALMNDFKNAMLELKFNY